MSDQRGDQEINDTIDRCNQALARVTERMVSRANILHYQDQVVQSYRSQLSKDFITKRINDADPL